MFLTYSSQIYDSVLALLYPQECLVCGVAVESARDGIACDSCWSKVRFFTADDVLCWKCGDLLPAITQPKDRESVRCHRCERYLFSAARACGGYQGALRSSVLSLKRTPTLCDRLSNMSVRIVQQAPLSSATMIIPVPLHEERQRARGFNQSEVIAERLSRRTKLPYVKSSLVRTRHTQRHRAGMDTQGREETVADAFFVRHPAIVAGEKILLIDDVLTTGATASSCAAALLSAGAIEVFVFTLARPI